MVPLKIKCSGSCCVCVYGPHTYQGREGTAVIAERVRYELVPQNSRSAYWARGFTPRSYIANCVVFVHMLFFCKAIPGRRIRRGCRRVVPTQGISSADQSCKFGRPGGHTGRRDNCATTLSVDTNTLLSCQLL